MKNWREASTLILTAFKGQLSKLGWDYSVLTLKRSSKSSFMPNRNVFPGGTIDFADSSEKWSHLFPDFVIENNSTSRLKEIPPIFAEKNGIIPKLLSLKIAAVRETFEETGILLCRKRNKAVKSNEWASFLVFDGLNEWRSKVQSDPTEFLNMCQYYNCLPDVENIHLWSNWFTPRNMEKKRFDTAFFIACLKENPIAVADEMEIEQLCWISPNKLIKLSKSKEIWLPPPQVYEISRLLQFKEINHLCKFALSRSDEGCSRWMPETVKTLDGSVSLLPGDAMYKVTNFCTPIETVKIAVTTQQLRSQSDVIHRMEFVGDTTAEIIVENYKPTNGHVLPAKIA